MKTITLLFAFLLFPSLFFAQLSGSYNVGSTQTYTSLSNASGLFAAINSSGLSGNVTINITSDITETGDNALWQWTVGSSYTLTIQPDGITQRTISSTSSTPVYFDGADRVTIDGGAGKHLTFKCTNTTPANTEAVFFFVGGATSNTITNCNIESNTQYFGPNPANAAIEIIASGGDNEVTISNCNIYNSGASAPLGCGIYINSYNSQGYKNTVTISNNNIYNFAATTASNVACGIYVNDSDADIGSPTQTTTSITGNSFYCNLGTAPTSNQTAILIDGGVNHTITGNYIGGQSASCGGSAWSNTGDYYLTGIEIRYGPTGTTYDVSSNTMQNINTTAYCWGYYNHKASVDFSSNTIGHASTANSIITSASPFKGAYLDDNDNSSYVNTIEDNTIANIQTSSNETWDVGIDVRIESDINILKNKIYKIGPLNNSANYSSIYGINFSVIQGTSTYTLVNNVVSLGAGLETASDWVSISVDIHVGATANLYYNSLFLDGSSNDDDYQWTCCVYRGSSWGTGTFVSNNNIIYNSRSDAAYDDEVYDFGSTGNVTSDYNILYAPNGVIAYYGGTTYTTLANWQTISSQDTNSAAQDPQFTNSSSNPPDLSLQVTNDKGGNLPGYTTDINGTTRDATTPDAGAYECDTPVPVELVYFVGKLEKEKIILNWQTATEINNYGFEVQKSVVSNQISKKDWETLGFVEGHGNSNSPKDYSFVDDNNSVAERSRSYRLKQIDTDGKFEYSDVVELNMGTPKEFKLVQNYPNPFNPTTEIAYSLPKNSNVILKVYNALGQEIATLINERQKAGIFNVIFDAANLPSGIYFYSIHTDENISVKKMLLIK